jgi:hypothetical protein
VALYSPVWRHNDILQRFEAAAATGPYHLASGNCTKCSFRHLPALGGQRFEQRRLIHDGSREMLMRFANAPCSYRHIHQIACW